MRTFYGITPALLFFAVFAAANEAEAGVAGKYFAVQEIPFVGLVPASDVYLFNFDKTFLVQNTVDEGTWTETNFVVVSFFQASIELKSVDPPTTASIEFVGLHFGANQIAGIGSYKNGMVSVPLFVFFGAQR